MIKKINLITDLKLDTSNANRGTDRGRQLLAESLSSLGAGRSIVCDKNGTVIGGNKTLESAQKLGLAIEVIHTKGEKLVAVIRDDLDLENDVKARALAYADNRISELDLDWDTDQIIKDIELINIEGLWTEDELEQLQDGLDLKEFEAIAAGNGSEDKTTGSNAESDMVPFHCLLSQEQRQKLFDAINHAKSQHRLETTADALDVIAEEYLK